MVVDTSVAVPTLIEGHPQHRACLRVVRDHRPAIAGHAWIETYAVVTRLPLGASAGEDAVRLLGAHFPDVRWPAPADLDGFLARCTKAGISGGAVYDALVALAVSTGGPLLSRDRRARRTYLALGIEVAAPDDLG